MTSTNTPAFRHFIEVRAAISEAHWQAIDAAFDTIHLPANTALLNAGQVCRHLYFVETGLLRFVVLGHDGTERTKFFTVAPYLFSSHRSFARQVPAQESIRTVEPCVLRRIDRGALQQLTAAVPPWTDLIRLVTQQVQHLTEQILTDLQHHTAEERYQRLLRQHPDLVLRVPLQDLASFLGIAPQSLSRIRRRVAGDGTNLT